MSACVFPGSFDPITRGHVDLIERVAVLFDSVTVTVMVNRSKTGMIPYEERVLLIRKACAHLPNVKVELWKGLLADYMRDRPGSVVIRGVRGENEFGQEMLSADMNRRLNPSMETLLIPASTEWLGVSSSAVREIASFGGDIREYVPECICREIRKWFNPAEAAE